jgi:hypothetical protein
MANLGVERLGAGHAEENAAQNGKSPEPFMGERPVRIRGRGLGTAPTISDTQAVLRPDRNLL